MKKIILASKSPRRKDILNELGYTFTISVSDYEEVIANNLKSPSSVAEEFAVGKATAVFNNVDKENSVVIGADTIVVLDDKILGKPKDKKDAKEMLWSLSGRTHSVITGFCVISSDKKVSGSVITEVEFNPLTKAQIDEYVENYLPLDKAGAYGIQDGYPLVKEYRGSYTNIVGLPKEKIEQVLKEFI